MKSILVVGGGFAGLKVAYELKKSGLYRVALVDPKDYFEITIAQLRAIVDPTGVGQNSRIAYREILGNDFVQGEVVELAETSVKLADGKTLTFDTLVLAPGSSHPSFPWVKPNGQNSVGERDARNRAEHDTFLHASSYAVMGGGLVGVELAGELASAAPQKKVRLVHNGSRLLPALSLSSSRIAEKHLRELGVEIVLNRSDVEPIPGEKVYQAFSPVPRTDFLSSVSPSILNEKKRIVVDSTLRVLGHTQWYALGDAAETGEPMMAITAGTQAEYLVRHLIRSARHPEARWKPYRPGPSMAFVPIGKMKGFSQLPFGSFTWKALVEVKRKDLLIGLFRSRFGLKKLA